MRESSSEKDRENFLFRMLQSRTNLPGSGLLIGVSPWIIALTSYETIMTLCSSARKLLDTMSFTYFFIEGDTFMASLSRISSVILSNAFSQIALSNFHLVFDLLGGKVLYTLSTAGLVGVECQSTLFPVCRLIFTVVSRLTLFLSCLSISTSSSSSSSSSSRLIVAFSASPVLDRSFSREGSDHGSGLLRSIGCDLLSLVFSTSPGFSAKLISMVFRVKRFLLLSNTELT